MLVWASSGATPWDSGIGSALGVCWSPDLALYVATGLFAAAGAAPAVVATSPDGNVWTGRTVASAPALSSWSDVCWSSSLGKFVAVGLDTNSGAGTNAVWTSPDGVTWTAHGNPFVRYNAISCVWSAELGLFVIGGVGGNLADPNSAASCIATSPDGTTWTVRTTPWDDTHGSGGPGRNTGSVRDLAWSAELGLLVAAGNSWIGTGVPSWNPGATVMTSPDGIAWTQQTTPFDSGGELYDAVWVPELLEFAVVGNNASVTESLMTSNNGTAWFDHSDPSDPTIGGMCDCGGRVLAGGPGVSGEISDSTDLLTWVAAAALTANAIAFSSALDLAVAVGTGSPHAIYFTTVPVPPVTPTGPALNCEFSI